MAMIGNPIVSTDFPKDTFSGNGSTTAFTMQIAPASVNAVIVVVSGITQDPSTYTISGTTLTFSAAPPTGTSNISVRHLGVAGIPNTPSDASVTAAKLASGAALSNLGTSQLASANMPAGSVIQVVSSAYSTEVTNSTYTWADTGLTATITPKYSTSKILVLVNEGCLAIDTNVTGIGLQLLRAGSNIATFGYYIAYSGGTPNYNAYASLSYLDSPATASATTYKVQFRSEQSNARARVHAGSTTATITLMEIAQ